VAALLTGSLVLKSVKYIHYINTSYRSAVFVFEMFASCLPPQYVVVFCHIKTACSVPECSPALSQNRAFQTIMHVYIHVVRSAFISRLGSCLGTQILSFIISLFCPPPDPNNKHSNIQYQFLSILPSNRPSQQTQ
jgi:hypothetical protein